MRRRLDPEKGVNKLFASVRIFFRGVEGDHILTVFSGGVASRQIEEQKQL